MPHNPETDGTFGAYLRGGAPLGGRGPDVIVDEPTWRTRDQIDEGRTPEGGKYKATTDGNGHTVTEETTPSGHQRKHVKIRIRSGR
ncbi:hypothetical protein [Streptosporangium sp. NPDC006930]|uniref:hypothetical protein n=1 Tax=Streptosporangium sp. NPDC006930 TaxID=3154783 RepID=UPI00343AEBD8